MPQYVVLCESPRVLQWSTPWTEQLTDQSTPMSTKLCRSPYQPYQTARSYNTDSAIAADQDESYIQDL